MIQIRTKLIFWTGNKHSGKTTNAAKLVEIARSEGFTVAGLLALSLYRNGRLIGFDALDLQSGKRASLARRKTKENETRPFTFNTEGLKLGRLALGPNVTKSADLVIVDEFGPLEFDQRGWRKNVDSLLASSHALILLVVRQELIDAVKQLYKDIPSRVVIATERDSIGEVVTLLKNRQCKVESKMIKLDRMLMIQEKATAIIMAGGDSLRMGADKTMLPIHGKPMIEKIAEQLHGTFDQILISANEPDKFAFLGLEVVPDRIPGQGPLMGIASALEASTNEINFVVACDIPYINLSFVSRMLAEAKEADIVVPITAKYKLPESKKRNTHDAVRNTRFEPLFAVYRKSALDAINKVLSSGGRKISDVFARCKVKYFELETNLSNLNTIAEYKKFRKMNSE